jgi:hypothetical protein
VVELEDEADLLVPEARDLPVGTRPHVEVGHADGAAGRPFEAAEEVQQGALADTRLPHDGDRLPRRDREVDPAEDTDGPGPVDELLDQPPGFNLVASLHPTGDPRGRHS